MKFSLLKLNNIFQNKLFRITLSLPNIHSETKITVLKFLKVQGLEIQEKAVAFPSTASWTPSSCTYM